MPVVQLTSSYDNRQQRRARTGKLSNPVSSTQPPSGRSDTTVRGVAALPAEQAVLLDLFGRPPVVFHRSFVEIAGGVSGALWLSYALTLSQEQEADGGATFFLSLEQCTEATGMSPCEQNHARENLRNAGLLQELRQGGTLRYRLDFEHLAGRLQGQSADSWTLQSDCLDRCVRETLHANAA
jgi:hypothetical protein